MARIRTIKPGFFKSEDLSGLDAETHILAAGLLCYADDEGYFNANPMLIKAEIFPLRTLERSIDAMLADLERSKYIRLGLGSDGRSYGHIVNFLEHQVISHAQESKIALLEISWNAPVMLHPEGKGKERNKERKQEGASAVIPDWIPEQTWADFIEMRKKLRKPLTTKAAELIIAKLEKFRTQGHSPEVVLNRSIENGWQGVFEPPKEGSNGKQSYIEQRINAAFGRDGSA